MKLNEIQSKLKAPKAQKNSFGNYNYRSCEDIVEALKPIINEAGYWLIITDEMVMLGNRFYIKATATLTNGKDIFSATGFAREEETKKGMDASQITGSASSYARKYALNGLLAIDDTKDSDSTNYHGKEEPKKEATKTNDLPWLNQGTKEYKDITEILEKRGAISDVLKLYKLSAVVKADLDLIIVERNKKANG